MRVFSAVRKPPFQLTPSLNILYQFLELMGGIKPELDWTIVQARFELLAANEETKGGAEALSFDALDRRHFRCIRSEDHQGTRIRSTASCRCLLVHQ